MHEHANRATTRRQLELVCRARHHSLAILRPLEPPGVVHYCGYRLLSGSRKVSAASESRIAAEAGRYLDSLGIGFAYGALASGADIIIAEQVLARDLELHVVLPFAVDEFRAESVALAGEEWCSRFSACIESASSVSITSDSRYDGDDVLYEYGSKIAMGHAINRASFLGAKAAQLAAWDGNPGTEKAGSAHDVAVWTRAGWPSYTIRATKRRSSRSQAEPSTQMRRTIAAVLFADFHGFSRLRDEQFPAFVHSVLGKLATVLDEEAARVQWRRSWGDAIQVVFDDIVAAARCALRLQSVVDAFVWDDLGLPADLRMRIGAHAGPVFQLFDPVTSEAGWWGRESIRAARIEPRTPEGAVYVSDAFASLLALEPNSGLATEYVGRITTAKEFETVPMHHLRPTDPSQTFGWPSEFNAST